MQIPRGFAYKGSTQLHVLQIICTLYGGCDSGRTYFIFISNYLQKMGFQQSTIDPCLFCYKDIILMMYVDDFIIAGRLNEAIDDAIQIIGNNTDVEDKGEITDYVGVHVTKHDDNTLTLTQPRLNSQRAQPDSKSQ